MAEPAHSRSDWMAAISRAGRLFNSTLVLDEVLNLVMDSLVQVTGAERGFVVLVDERTGELEFRAARDVEQRTIQQPSFEVSRNVIRRVIDEGRPRLMENAVGDAEFARFASVAGLRLRSILCAPLLVKGTAIGAVYVENRLRSGAFTETDREMLMAFADEASIAIENARLFGDLQSRMAEIAAMKEYQDDVFRSVGSAIIALDLAGRITLFNNSAERVFALPREEAVGKPYTEVFGPGLSSRLLGRIARATVAGAVPGRLPELECDLPGREKVWLQVTVSGLWDVDHRPIGVVVVADDLTETRELEIARRRAEAERQRIRDLFGKYVAPAVAERLLENPEMVGLGGQIHTITVLFADIRGYTALSEKMRPDEVLELLNRYLAVATGAVFQRRGTLDKYMGDAVMAFFNAPLPQENHAAAAVRAALSMQEAVARLSDQAEVQVAYGIGVNTGEAIVGNIGTEQLMNYTAIGDAVNVASRLQSRAAAGQLLITDSTYQSVRDLVEAEPLEPMQVKGRHEPVVVYRVLGLRS